MSGQTAETVTLTPSSSYNHFLSSDRVQVMGEYRCADGQFILSQLVNKDTTFNLSIVGMGVVKFKTFDTFEEVLFWANSSSPMSVPCKRVRAKFDKAVSFQAKFNGEDLGFSPFRPQHVPCQDCFTLPLGEQGSFLAFDIECGDVQVSITNFQVGGRPLGSLFRCSYSKEIQMTRVTMGIKFSRFSPAPQSLCRINGNVLTPETLLYVNVTGPIRETQTGSYFRLWVSRPRRSQELLNQRGHGTTSGQPDRSYVQLCSDFISVEPLSTKTYLIYVQRDRLIIADPWDFCSKSDIKEDFDQQDCVLWVEFYRITFSVHKTTLLCDWCQGFDSDVPPGCPPAPPCLVYNAQSMPENLHPSRMGAGRRRRRSELDDLPGFSPQADSLIRFSPPPNSSTNNSPGNCEGSPVHIQGADSSNDCDIDTVNKNYSPSCDLRNFDPLLEPIDSVHVAPANNNINSDTNPMSQYRHLNPIETQGVRGMAQATSHEKQYSDHLRESQMSQEDSYLSILSCSNDGTKNASSDQTFFTDPNAGSCTGMTSINRSAPIPCHGPKQRQEKYPESTCFRNTAKRLTERFSKKSERDSNSSLGATAKASSEFLNEGFDSDLETPQSDSMARSSVSINGQSTSFSPQCEPSRNRLMSSLSDQLLVAPYPEAQYPRNVPFPQQTDQGFDNDLDTAQSDNMARCCSINNGQPMSHSSQCEPNGNRVMSSLNEQPLMAPHPEAQRPWNVPFPQQIDVAHDLDLSPMYGGSVLGSLRPRPHANRNENRHRNSSNSIAQDSGVGADSDENICDDHTGDEERPRNRRRERLSSYRSDDSHHQTRPKWME